MSDSGSMFLVEITVPELRSYVKCKDYLIKSQFADVFSVILKDPKDLEKILTARKPKRKTKVRKSARDTLCKHEHKELSGKSVLFTNDVDNLTANMKMYPMELSLWSKVFPKYKIASTNIPWSAKFIEYLEQIGIGSEAQSVSLTGEYNVFDEVTSRRMATIKLNIKMSYLPKTELSEETPEPFLLTGLNSNASTLLNPVHVTPFNLAEETGIIKTLYAGGKKNIKKSNHKKTKRLEDRVSVIKKEATVKKAIVCDNNNISQEKEDSPKITKMNSSIISLVKSETDIDKNKQIDLMKCKSCSSMNFDHLNILNYIFGDPTNSFGNQIYCVNYFTVQDAKSDSPTSKSTPKSTPRSSVQASPKASENLEATEKSSTLKRFRIEVCNDNCPAKSVSIISVDLPEDIAKDLIEINQCKNVDCKHKQFRKLPPPPDDRILLDLTSLKQDCCSSTPKIEVTEKAETVFGGMIAKMTIGDDPCFCECECKFGFTKQTRYCKICGGYEIKGEDAVEEPQFGSPFPCPIYHNLTDKPKIKPSITSDTKKNAKAKSLADKSIESDKETKKGKKKKKEDKFKFNYGYTGIPPHIGHDYCAQPCTGTLGAVPKSMGWLWTAEDIPGMKFRPSWKPGAVNKHVLRMLRMAKNPGEVFSKKKRRKDAGKGKRPLKRPLLVVHKKDGEYTVTMETMKAYAKPRAINQVPFEDKPALTYTVGRTEEENRQRRIKKERAQRRLERMQREFIQSAFRDMCQEICLKTYQQALGILPNAEDPNCPCYPADPGPDKTDLDHSCSCSEDSKLTFSDTDSDEWLIEFTPPTATFDPAYKTKKITTTDNSSQYTYLDYRVKLLDRYGNPVPRFFKGPDGKEQCSDLGGFWGPDKKWIEINVDGYIGPDGKFAPNSFIGPDGEHVDAEIGKFQTMDGRWLVVGIDGYVDPCGKWKYYSRGKATPISKKHRPADSKNRGGVAAGAAGGKKPTISKKKSETTWSCFGDASPKELSKLGILGHGHDRKLLLDTLNTLIAQGEDVTLPSPSAMPRSKRKKTTRVKYRTNLYDSDKIKCKHPVPSSKGVIAMDGDGNKIYFRLNKYNNKRPKQRVADLNSQGISLSSFHVPCFRSFINAEMMKKELYKKRVALAKKRGYVEKDPYKPASRAAEPKYRNVFV